MDRRQIHAHAGLRGIAALLVVGYHLELGTGYRFGWETATFFFRRGYLAVDLFFVLSGFIISFVNAADRSAPVTRGEVASFLRARFARLYPLVLFTLAVMLAFRGVASAAFLAAHRSPPYDWGAGSIGILLSQLLLLNAWNWGPPGWNIPSWSISAEVFAYLLFPLIVNARIARRGAAEAIMLAAIIGFYLAVALSTGVLDIIGGMAPFRCAAGFMSGMLLFYHRDHVRRAGATTLSIVQVIAMAAIVALLCARTRDPLIMPAFAALVVATWTDRGVVARILGRRILLWLGEISYSVYLIHVVVLEVLWFGWERIAAHFALTPPVARAVWIMLAYVAVLGLAHWTFGHVERPARQWLARRLTGHRAPPIEVSPPGP